MECTGLNTEDDIEAMRALVRSLASGSTIVDFDEQMLLPTVRETTRIWRHDHKIVGFAYIDDYNNLWFETEPEHALLDNLETEIIDWGVTCLKQRNPETGMEDSLDCGCRTDNSHRIKVLKMHGFIPQHVRTLKYSRPLTLPIIQYSLPEGFSIRCVKGKEEVERLVSLHRAAFGTNNMTVERRLAIMNVPNYIPEMDLVMVAPNGELAAFCVCGFNDPDKNFGYTDPIGTHRDYQRLGLGRVIVSRGLMILKNAGANVVELGTSSENIAMQKLANGLGFICISEKIWFSKAIS